MWIFISILVLSFLIFFHELGHFLVARFFGVRVEVFSVGFGKKILTKTLGDTQYALSMIPLGGYVKLKGQDDSDVLKVNYDKDSYTSKSPLQRIAILLAGPVFNILLAFILYVFIALIGKEELLPVVGNVAKDMPAYSAGIKSGDTIDYINSKKIHTWQDITKAIKDSQGAIKLAVLRDGNSVELELLPQQKEAKNIFGETIKKGFIGIAPYGSFGVVSYGVLDSIKKGFDDTLYFSTIIIQGVKKIITGVVPTSEVGGVISIVEVIHKASLSGFMQLLFLSALISINLGIVNLFPIPALDGGHILFNLYELIFRRPLNQTSLYYLTIFGWILLFLLMALGIYNDINRILF